MKLALIPPLSLLDYMQDEYALFLPPQFQDLDYCDMVTQHKGYRILDNGAAEGDTWPIDTIFEMATVGELNEVVVPDVIGDAQESMKLLDESYDKLASKHKFGRLRYMAVLQGQTVDDVIDYAYEVRAKHNHWITTLGVPRHLSKTTGDRGARLAVLRGIEDLVEEEDMDVHMLGADYNFVDEMYYVQSGTGGDLVRGTDTSMPFVYAFYGSKFNHPGHLQPAKRPEDYFNAPRSAFDLGVLDYNVKMMLHWTGNDR